MSARVDLLDLMDLPDAAGMNDDLRDWAQTDLGHTGTTAGHAPQPTRGPCSVCAKDAHATCLRCARPACPSHRGVMTGLCDRCVAATDERPAPANPAAGRFDDEVPAHHPELGIGWIE